MQNALFSLKCEGQDSPVGIDTGTPILAWKVIQKGYPGRQKNFRILLSDQKENLSSLKNMLWDYKADVEQNHVIYHGQELSSRSVYYWKVILTTDSGKTIESHTASFETGFLSPDCWEAQWINLSKEPLPMHQPEVNAEGEPLPVKFEEITFGPVHQVRKEFSVKKPVTHARLYMTAHGVYLPLLDGERIGQYELTPGHTMYRNQLFYQIYDITGSLTPGSHTIGAYIADGWYRGRMGFDGSNCQQGNELALLLQLELEYEDGTSDKVCSDDSFQVTEGAYIYADMMTGEKYDARLEKKDFFLNGYKNSDFRYAKVMEETYDNLRAQTGNHILVSEVLLPKNWYRLSEEEVMFDFGTCIAGRVRIQVSEEAGQEIRIEHSEVEGPGHSFTKNIITPYREQIETYICKGEPYEIYEPMFNYHGFRYVKISGLTGEINPDNFSAYVLGTEMERTSAFSCSDERINQLQRNILRSQFSNMISIPTDCPQREKAGWTGDVQIYASTACFNQDAKNFFLHWLEDVRYCQSEDGQIPIIVPFLPGHARAFKGIGSSAGWSEVIIILPWVLYQYYGDPKILADFYDSMEKWVEYVRYTSSTENPEGLQNVTGERAEHLKYIWNTGFHFGDWLTPSVSMNPETGDVDLMQSAIMTMDIVPTFFYAYSCILMEQISHVLNKEERAGYYAKLYQKIKDAFQYEYINDDGAIKSNLQGIQVLALHTGLVEGKAKEKTIQKLVELIHENHDSLDTGFLSTPYLMDVLTEAGYKDLAWKLLYNEQFPSWLYEVKMGATSIWESWQGILPNGQISHVSMAHYAFGCIGDWMYRNILGIRSLAPGYKRILFSPDLHCGLTHAEGSYDSIHGFISCAWEIRKKDIFMTLTVPFNTEAQLSIPNASMESLTLNGKAVSCKDTNSQGIFLDLPAGNYQLTFQRETE